jgi:DMSO/TMAO reductase YedYZ molybdopterin-dependent catalytic subunit
MMGRRKFIELAGGAAVALASAGVAGYALAPAEAPEVPAGGWGGFTPNKDFYTYSYAGTPRAQSTGWKVKIHGLVANPFELDLVAIKAMPQVSETLTLECISNPPNGRAIGNAAWVGSKLKPLLERARPTGKAVYVALRGADGYTTGVPVDELMREENFLPYLMNGTPLPPEHGYPLRLFIPGKYGMKQPKWLTEIEFLDHEFLGFGESRGWSNSAWRKVNSGFFYPQISLLARLTHHAALRIGHNIDGLFDRIIPEATVTVPVEMVGWALAGPSGIRRVEISTDDGATWSPAELFENRSPYIWTVWKYLFAPRRAGRYRVRVCATDGDGHSQPPAEKESQTGWAAQPRVEIAVTMA